MCDTVFVEWQSDVLKTSRLFSANRKTWYGWIDQCDHLILINMRYRVASPIENAERQISNWEHRWLLSQHLISATSSITIPSAYEDDICQQCPQWCWQSFFLHSFLHICTAEKFCWLKRHINPKYQICHPNYNYYLRLLCYEATIIATSFSISTPKKNIYWWM